MMEETYNERYSRIKEMIDNAKAAGKGANLDDSDSSWWRVLIFVKLTLIL